MEKKAKTKRALVTGSTGFVGSHLVEALIARGYEVVALVREKSNRQWLKGLPVKIVLGDIMDKDSLSAAVRGCNYVYHLAGLTKAIKRSEYYLVNAVGTNNLIERWKSENTEVKRFLYVSSLAAIGPAENGVPIKEDQPPHPVSDYGKSKLKGEEVLKSYIKEVPITILRPGAIYGPRDRDILHFFRWVKKGIQPLLGGEERYVDLCHVNDIIKGIILAAETPTSSGETFFLASGVSYSWEKIGEIIAQALGRKGKKVVIPYFLLALAASFAEVVGWLKGKPAPFNRQKLREMQQKYWICDISKARIQLGYRPQVSIGEGIKQTASWYIENGWL